MILLTSVEATWQKIITNNFIIILIERSRGTGPMKLQQPASSQVLNPAGM